MKRVVTYITKLSREVREVTTASDTHIKLRAQALGWVIKSVEAVR